MPESPYSQQPITIHYPVKLQPLRALHSLYSKCAPLTKIRPILFCESSYIPLIGIPFNNSYKTCHLSKAILHTYNEENSCQLVKSNARKEEPQVKVGFIGTGSMGSLLIDAFLSSGALEPCDVLASNRSLNKLLELEKRHPGISICGSNRETALGSDIVFLCVKPLEFKTLTDEIGSCLRSEQIVVSITSPVQLHHLNPLCRPKLPRSSQALRTASRVGLHCAYLAAGLIKKTGLYCYSYCLS